MDRKKNDDDNKRKSLIVDSLVAIGPSKGILASRTKEPGSAYLAKLDEFYDHIKDFIAGRNPIIQDAFERSHKAIKEAVKSTDGFSQEQKDACCAFVGHVRPLLQELQQRKPFGRHKQDPVEVAHQHLG